MSNEITIPILVPSETFSGPREELITGVGGVGGGTTPEALVRQWNAFLIQLQRVMDNYAFDKAADQLFIIQAVRVGDDSLYVDIDGTAGRIRSSNYVSGAAGAGFTLEPNFLEVGNIACRGSIRTAVFQKDVVSAVGGNLVILPADVLATDMISNDKLIE